MRDYGCFPHACIPTAETMSGVQTGVYGTGLGAGQGCWFRNDCSNSTRYGDARAGVRRPTTKTVDGVTFHEGAVLRDAVAYVAGMIRRNAFAPPLGSLATDPLPIMHPNYVILADAENTTWWGLQKKLGRIGYGINPYYDRNMDRVLLVIEPATWSSVRNSDGRNWGMFIFNTRPTRYTVVEVPHPVYDQHSELMGSEAFEKADALALFIAGSHRQALDDQGSTRVGETISPTGQELLGMADAAHHAETMWGEAVADFKSGFEWAHEGFTTVAPDGIRFAGTDPASPTTNPGVVSVSFIQWHGFNEAGFSYYYDNHVHAVVSAGGNRFDSPFSVARVGGSTGPVRQGKRI